MNEDSLTPEERALMNDETVHDSRDRSFCGIELGHVDIINRRYIERLMSKFSEFGYSTKEIALGYAFILTLDMPRLRVAARSMDAFDEGLDAFIKPLPSPLPAGELTRLQKIVAEDVKAIKAAHVELKAKPGASTDQDAPPNS